MNILDFISDDFILIPAASYSGLKDIIAIKMKIRFYLRCNRILSLPLSYVGYMTSCLCTSSPKHNPLSIGIKYVSSFQGWK